MAAASAVLDPETVDVTNGHYDEFELTVLQQSKDQGFNSYDIQISLREDCLLKAARVYMIFDVLEKIGEIIKSEPAVEQLEEEQFDHDFSVTLVTKEPKEDIQKKIMKVSEVESVELHDLNFNELRVAAIAKEDKIVSDSNVAPEVVSEKSEKEKAEVKKQTQTQYETCC